MGQLVMTKCACQNCGKEFHKRTGKAATNKFCSQSCYHAGDRIRAIKRFWKRIKKTSGCWKWLGFHDADGYGRTGIGRAHRVIWIITYGKIPRGKSILHRCNNPSCINPQHMYAGTPADNMVDRQNAGRYDSGELHPMAILNKQQVQEIRKLYVPRKNGGVGALAQQFGVAPTTIHAIITRKIWKHI